MSLSIQTNIQAITAHKNLMGTQNGLSTAMERLSSGFRINRAADDAAGLAISEKLQAQVGGLDQAQRNGLIDQVLHSQVELLGKRNSEIPSDLQTIVHKAIDRDPDRRYQTAQELAEDLHRFINDEPIKARRVGATAFRTPPPVCKMAPVGHTT